MAALQCVENDVASPTRRRPEILSWYPFSLLPQIFDNSILVLLQERQEAACFYDGELLKEKPPGRLTLMNQRRGADL